MKPLSEQIIRKYIPPFDVDTVIASTIKYMGMNTTLPEEAAVFMVKEYQNLGGSVGFNTKYGD